MKKYQLVEITFLDHYQSDGEDYRPIPCAVVGYLVGEDKSCYYLCWWVCDNNPFERNSESITIVKHKGIKVRKLS